MSMNVVQVPIPVSTTAPIPMALTSAHATVDMSFPRTASAAQVS